MFPVLKPKHAGLPEESPSIIGFYGPWAASLCEDPPLLSFRREEWTEKERKSMFMMAWANEVARRGYVVLGHNVFTFGSRRVMYSDVAGIDWGPHKMDSKMQQEAFDWFDRWLK